MNEGGEMKLANHYFASNLLVTRELTRIFDAVLLLPFKNLNLKDAKSLSICRHALVQCLVEIATSSMHLIIVEKKSFIDDLNLCIQATKICEEYVRTNTDPRKVIAENVDDIFLQSEPSDIAMLGEINQILLLISWKKALY